MVTDIPNNTKGTKPATTVESKSKDYKTTDQKKIRIIMEFLQGADRKGTDPNPPIIQLQRAPPTPEAMRTKTPPQ